MLRLSWLRQVTNNHSAFDVRIMAQLIYFLPSLQQRHQLLDLLNLHRHHPVNFNPSPAQLRPRSH